MSPASYPWIQGGGFPHRLIYTPCTCSQLQLYFNGHSQPIVQETMLELKSTGTKAGRTALTQRAWNLDTPTAPILIREACT